MDFLTGLFLIGAVLGGLAVAVAKPVKGLSGRRFYLNSSRGSPVSFSEARQSRKRRVGR